ncbi:TPA: hypothetical protein N3A33_001131 [Salmonella enterica subsp. salamae serovar 28:r:e,n,z15]|nr:hypothetical protein [Salmonella enterica subsp. salamae serovar 28:r:e,n,z15]
MIIVPGTPLLTTSSSGSVHSTTRIPSITVVGYNGRRGDGSLQSQGWTQVTGGTFTPMPQTDGYGGYYLNIVKKNGQSWEIKQPASYHPEDLIRYGGRLFCRFRLSGGMVEGRYAFAFYLKIKNAEIPVGVTLANDGSPGMSPTLMNFAVATRGGNITFCQHRGLNSGPLKEIADWGRFDNEWHTMELIYPGNNSVMVTPVLDGVAKDPVSLSLSSAIAPEDTIYMTGITTGIVYEVDIAGFEGQIYRDRGEYTLTRDDDGSRYFFPAGYHRGKITLSDTTFAQGFSVEVMAEHASVTLQPENSAVLIQPPGSSEGYPKAIPLSTSVRLIQSGTDGRTWVVV